MAIATDSPEVNMKYYIEKFNLGKWFDIEKIVYNDGTIPGKPSPDLYALAVEAIHVIPQNCIVFEDTVSGIQAAYYAGIRNTVLQKGKFCFQLVLAAWSIQMYFI